jgi:hypothetical protein
VTVMGTEIEKSLGHLKGLGIMKSVVVFAGRNGVDFSEVRTAVLRIPEVSIKIRQAQKVIDSMGLDLDLVAIANSDDAVVNRHTSVKTILSSLVQLALFERSLRSQRKPNYLLGAANEQSVLDLIKGESLSSFVQKALAAEALECSQADAGKVIPLTSQENLEFAVLEVTINENGQLKGANEVLRASEAKKLFVEMIEKMNVTKFVNIGPSNALASSKEEVLEPVTVIDSIEADPILNWFWQGLRPVTAYAV